jgi:hypothetical protein
MIQYNVFCKSLHLRQVYRKTLGIGKFLMQCLNNVLPRQDDRKTLSPCESHGIICVFTVCFQERMTRTLGTSESCVVTVYSQDRMT